MRKAFLELDSDRDGYIEAADIVRYFGDEDSIDLIDLKKLMREKKRLRIKHTRDAAGVGMAYEGRDHQLLIEDDENDEGSPRLRCQDFTFWVGEAIHLRENFYFRHDSMRHR